MMVRHANGGEARCPKGITDLLPWYMNETLEPPEVQQVERHLAGCPHCQSELAELRAIKVALISANDELGEPSADRLAALRARINEYEAGRAPSLASSLTLWWKQLFPPFSLGWPQGAPLPAFAKVTIAVQFVIILVLAGGLLFLGPENRPGDLYKTLSGPAPVSEVPSGRIKIVFQEGVPEREIRELILGLKGNIVEGPTPLGAYTIAVPPTSIPQRGLDKIVEELRRQSNLIKFVERSS